MNVNVEVGTDRTFLLVGFRSCLTYADRIK